jgi:transcriptional regulator with XRE-family HTH domain
MVNTARMGLGDRIRRAREGAGLSQNELARRCGVSRAAVSQWETPDIARRRRPTLSNLQTIARETGRTLDWLTQEDQLREAPTASYGGSSPASGPGEPSQNELTNLVNIWRRLPRAVRRRMLDLLHALQGEHHR